MFDDFRGYVKKMLIKKKLTYSQLSEATGIAVSTIKCFMCGATDSRRVAEKIASALDIELFFKGGKYYAKKTHNIL